MIGELFLVSMFFFFLRVIVDWLFLFSATDSRPTTPGPGTPTNGIASPAVNALPSTPAPVADERRKSAFEKMVTDLVDVDVDLDF